MHQNAGAHHIKGRCKNGNRPPILAHPRRPGAICAIGNGEAEEPDTSCMYLCANLASCASFPELSDRRATGGLAGVNKVPRCRTHRVPCTLDLFEVLLPGVGLENEGRSYTLVINTLPCIF